MMSLHESIKAPPTHHQQESKHLTHPKYRPDIDGLRAIAVLSVVGFHAFPSLVKGGFIGVDIFFVISGYLISTIIFGNLESNTFSFVEFYSRRIKRIFPALILVLIACFTFGWFALLADEYKQLGKHIAGGAAFISNFIFWNESGYFDNSAETKPLLHLWTLGIEEQFYIVWPVLLWASWKKKFNLLTITIVIATVSFLLNMKGLHSDAIATFYSPQSRFWELLLGSVLAYVTLYKRDLLVNQKHKLDMWLSAVIYANSPNKKGNTLRNIQSLLGAALISIGILIITKEQHFPGTWALLPTLGAVLIISAGSQSWLNRVILSNRVLVWFGLISFPFYLWHWPLLSFARIVESGVPTPEIRLGTVVVSIVLAFVTYKLIEKPIRFGRFGNAKTIVLTVLMVAVGSVGQYTYKNDGLGFRLPKIIKELTSYTYDFKESYREFTCFLEPEQDYTNFSDCGVTRNIAKKTILVWGDSNAAHLYPGINDVFGAEFNIIQRTASGCPPILGLEVPERKYCKEINDKTLELIIKEKPNKVILTAAGLAGYDLNEFSKTISKLKEIGIINIDLIGPVPLWTNTLSNLLYLSYKKDIFHNVPTRMNFGLNPIVKQWDATLKDFSVKERINYISVLKIMCTEEGCITRLGDTGDMLTSWDVCHLTSIGSKYVVSQFPQ